MKVSEIKIGESYNDIQILSDLGRINRDRRYMCKCLLCGKEFDISAKHIGSVKSCKDCNIKSKIIDLTGQRFGRLVALEYVGRKNGRTLWKCKCDCGKESITGYSNLRSGNTRSCGCMEEENRMNNMQKQWESNRKSISESFQYSGNITSHPLYGLWGSMQTRCYNRNAKSYPHYGGRGIKVCDRWLGNCGFENFVNDMGERPSIEHSLDRINPNGDYCPENCRWANTIEQGNNKLCNIYLFIADRRISAKDLFRALDINYNTAIHQLKRGVDINFILSNKHLDMRTSEMRSIRADKINFNRTLSKESERLIPDDKLNSLLNKNHIL